MRRNMGVSIRTRNPVLDDLKYFLPASFEVPVGAIFYSFLVGIPFGVISAVKQDQIIDHVIRVLPCSVFGADILADPYEPLHILLSSGLASRARSFRYRHSDRDHYNGCVQCR
jgi:ABC-type antimicrobial peptide transport system permease subunit